MRRATILAGLLVLAGCSDTGSEPTPTGEPVSSPAQSDDPAGPATGDTSEQETGETPDPEAGEADGPLTVLVVGVDQPTGSRRADVIMLVRVNGDRDHASVMSIHRDTWVDIPGHGQNKINAAFAYGGHELLSETVEDLYSADIDHTAVVDFEGFSELSTVLGPITVETADGPVVLEGDDALAFVRERYSLPSGDFDRVRRQQAYVAAAADAIRSAGTDQLIDLARLAGNYVTVDGKGGLAVHALVVDLVDETDIEGVFFSAPHGGTGWSADGQSIVLVDEASVESLADAYRDDTVDEWLASGDPETLDSRPIR